jgi:hypothetical protein
VKVDWVENLEFFYVFVRETEVGRFTQRPEHLVCEYFFLLFLFSCFLLIYLAARSITVELVEDRKFFYVFLGLIGLCLTFSLILSPSLPRSASASFSPPRPPPDPVRRWIFAFFAFDYSGSSGYSGYSNYSGYSGSSSSSGSSSYWNNWNNGD